jgi:ABC-type antimicrobial peptide transport system permease subunit
VDEIWTNYGTGAEDAGGQGIRQPFQIVDLEFKPDGANDSVHVLDRVDLNSVAGLREGGTAQIVYSSIDPEIMATSTTLEEMLRQSTPFIVSSLAAGVASTVGLLGLLLALMGIYGTASYIVVLRTREVGIRMAIGAQKRDVLGLILRESARPVLAGLMAGILMAAGASYLARGVFYGLNGIDGISVAGVSVLFLAIALLAPCPPARRAMRVDPMVALRYE